MRFLAALLFLVSGIANANVQFATDRIEVAENAGSIQIPVVLTAQDSKNAPVTVNYRTIAGTATPATDYQTTSGTLVWDEGDYAQKTITVPIVDDNVSETLESFSVELFSPSGTTLGSQSLVGVDVYDDDGSGVGEFQFTATDILTFESNSTVTLGVRRLNGTRGAVSVEVTRVGGGTASPGADFADAAQVLSWADGEAGVKTFTITIINDGVVEPTETINYSLINPTGGATITRGNAVVSIADDDVEGPGQVEVVSPSITVVEGQGVVSIPVARTGGSGGSAAVNYSTQPGTADASDFSPVAGVLTWDDGDTSIKTVSVQINNDSIPEATETFKLAITPVGSTVVGANSATTVSLIDDDVASSSSVASLSASRYTVNDTDSSVAITVNRTNPAIGGSVNVYTTAGSAQDGSDFIGVSKVLTFLAGEASRTVDVQILPHAGATPESDETFLFSLQSGGGVEIGSPDSAIVTIKSSTGSTSDSVVSAKTTAADSVGCGIGSPVPTIVVGPSGTSALINLVRTNPAAEAEVQYQSIDCSATAGTDYTGANGTAHWNAGDASSKLASISIIRGVDDTDLEEEFLVQISPVSGASVDTPVVRVVIQPAGAAQLSTLGFSASSFTAGATSGYAELTVNRMGDLSRAASIDYATVDGTAIDGTDFTSVTGTLQWAANDDQDKSILVPITAAASGSAAKSFFVQLSNAVNAKTGTLKAQVNIAATGVSVVAFASTTIKVYDDSGLLRIKVRRVSGDSALSVPYSVLSGTAIAGTDFVATPGVLNWTAGDHADKEILVQLNLDASPSPDKTFTASLIPDTSIVQVSGSPTALVTLRSATAKESKGVGGCTVGPSDSVTFALMLLASLMWLGRRRLMARNS